MNTEKEENSTALSSSTTKKNLKKKMLLSILFLCTFLFFIVTFQNCNPEKTPPTVNNDDGSCGAAADKFFPEIPDSAKEKMCLKGVLSGEITEGSGGSWVWNCNSEGTGKAALCMSNPRDNYASCGSADKKFYSSNDIPDDEILCAKGNSISKTQPFPDTQNNIGWEWRCNSIDASNYVSCSARLSSALTYKVTIEKLGTGTGKVTSAPAGIDCGTDCIQSYEAGSVTLTATPDANSNFKSWSGDNCTGSTATCTLNVDAPKNIKAEFVPKASAKHKLTVTKILPAGGTVASTAPAALGLNCGTACDKDVNAGTVVQLKATAATGYTFKQWTNACTGTTNPCSVTMSAAKTATAEFVASNNVYYNLTTTKAELNDGSGTISLTPVGTTCGTNCAKFLKATKVTINATPKPGSIVSAWAGGGCSGTGSSCVVTLNANTTVNVTFSKSQNLANIHVDIVTDNNQNVNTGGKVTSAPAGIDCGTDCDESYPINQALTLTAVPNPGYKLGSWTSCTAKTNNALQCTVTMNAAKNIKANFIKTTEKRTLTVNVNKATAAVIGSVSSAPTGINACNKTACTFDFLLNSQVTLTATEGAGSKLTGWTGACTGASPSCVLKMSENKTVTANFAADAAPKVLNLSLTFGVGSKGNVAVTPVPTGGANPCTNQCSYSYSANTVVTLTAVAGIASRFDKWIGGPCDSKPAAVCKVTMAEANNISASFVTSNTKFLLSVSTSKVAGSKGGVVVGKKAPVTAASPTIVNCISTATADSTSDCSEPNLAINENIILTATPDSKNTNQAVVWTGCTSSSGLTCSVTLTGAKNVNVQFAK